MIKRILVVDDKETMCSLFQRLLTNYTVITANDGAKALGLYSSGERFNVIISDIRMPQLDGLTLLKEVKRISPDTEVILMTAYAEIGEAIKAMKSGAFDYLVKPFDSDEMLLTLEKALEIQELRSQKQRLQKELDAIKGFGPLVGQSEPMQKIYRFIDKASSSQAHVLITGESGTGKELVARSLHDRGLRQKGPFVALNCGALPIELAESELFGHIKGAFTGATMEKKGLFEEAQGGTLFLDEINSLPLPLQVKLNRAIEQNEARKVGSNKTYKIDVRLIAATNKDLQKEIQQGTFREDLYFRLNVIYLQLP
ncbi:MAG: sigma-54 dependent transcriptional regulator, partial [Planctomycetota bacterium]